MRKIFFREGVIILSSTNETGHELDHADLSYQYSSRENLRKIWLNMQKSPGIESVIVRHQDEDELFDQFRALFQVREAAGGLVRDDEERYLLIKRKGLWDLPKGHIEPAETPEEAAVREVSEECGIDLPEIEYFLTYTYHHYMLKNRDVLKITHWYMMKYKGDGRLRPQEEEEITEVKWVSRFMLEELKANTYPSLQWIFSYPNKNRETL